MISETYSTSVYNKFMETGNKNIFEEVIDKLILEKYSSSLEEADFIRSIPLEKKRLAILCLLGDNNEWMKIRECMIKGVDFSIEESKRDGVLAWLGLKGLKDKNIGKEEHIKDVLTMLRKYVKVGDVEKKKFGEVMTPLELVKEMMSKLPEDVWSNPNLKWLDPANGTGPYPAWVIYRLMIGLKDWEPDEEKRYKHIVENMIYACELQPKNMFLYMLALDPFDTYKLNVYTGSFLDNEFDYHMKNVWNLEKFDIVMGNPPYNQMIDMSFLQKSYCISDKFIFVHPSTWLLDEKGKQKKFVDSKRLVKDHLSYIELFNGNKIFGIQLFVPCVITFVDKNKKEGGIECLDKINKCKLTYKSIYDINKFSDNEIYFKIKEKIKKHSNSENLHKKIKNDKGGRYYVNLAQIRGHVDLNSEKNMLKPDFYTLCVKDISPTRSARVQREKTQASFDTIEEANNFISYVKTDFARFCLSINKNNQNLYCGEMEYIPWLDFSQEWNDDKLYEFFDISEEEVRFIKKNIPKYY